MFTLPYLNGSTNGNGKAPEPAECDFDVLNSVFKVMTQACIECKNIYNKQQYNSCDRCGYMLCCYGCAQFHYGKMHKELKGMVILL